MKKLIGLLLVGLVFVGMVFVPGQSKADNELLTSTWNFTMNNGAAENYVTPAANILNGKVSLTLTYDLNGTCLIGNDASAIIFDQNGWKYVSLFNYGQNCFSGQQIVTIPLSDFPGLSTNANLTTKFHARFWKGTGGPYTVTITSAVLNTSTPPPPPPPGPTPPPPPVTPQHIVVVLEENHDFTQVVGSMPYLNSLALQYGLATQMYANTHPSIGNYFELTTGNVITNNNNFSETLIIDNIAKRLEAAGKTWKVYAEGLPSVGYTSGDVGDYVKHHNPFAYFQGINVNNMVPLSQFDPANLPNFSFVVPDNDDNGHDGTLTEADAWLSTHIAPLFNATQFKTDGLLIITFDEADTDNTNGGGRIYTVFAGQNVKNGFQSSTVYKQENVLRTIAKIFNVGYPGDSVNVSDMTEFFK